MLTAATRLLGWKLTVTAREWDWLRGESLQKKSKRF
jgi:hypothetical protein